MQGNLCASPCRVLSQRASLCGVLLVFLLSTVLCSCQGGGDSATYTQEEIAEAAQGNDYDLMLEELETMVEECAVVKEEYLDGNLPDKTARQRVADIEERYQPVTDAINRADSNGELTYNQHKQLMSLQLNALDHMLDAAGRVMDDALDELDGTEAGEVLEKLLDE